MPKVKCFITAEWIWRIAQAVVFVAGCLWWVATASSDISTLKSDVSMLKSGQTQVYATVNRIENSIANISGSPPPPRPPILTTCAPHN